MADAPAEFAAGGQNFLTSGNRAITIMPMMRGDEAIGLLSVVRRKSGPLSDKQLSLLRTFAAQAVIAIENTRLLNELREIVATADRNGRRLESYQPLDLRSTGCARHTHESAARVCHADRGNIARLTEQGFQFLAFSGFDDDYRDYMKGLRVNKVDRGSVTGRAVLEKQVIHVPDVLADPEFTWFEAQKRGRFRTGLGVHCCAKAPRSGFSSCRARASTRLPTRKSSLSRHSQTRP